MTPTHRAAVALLATVALASCTTDTDDTDN